MRRIALLVLMAACSSPSGTTTSTSPPPTTTTTTLGAGDVYARVHPSLAFVETPIGSGSAVLIDATTLVTNAHVVWPADEVEVSFPDGSAGSVRVIAYDWIADLALLDVSRLRGLPAPVVLEPDGIEPGTAVFLIGYPADDGGSAVPAITAGIVSRTRTWIDGDLTFIQSDALIAGGQSGGALVDERGRVVGISGLSVGDGFALALSAADLQLRLPAMRRGDDPNGLGARRVSDLSGPSGSAGSVPRVLDETVFVFDGSPGDVVSVQVTGSSSLNADLVGPDGFVEATNEEPGVDIVLEADLVLEGPYFIVVYPEFEPLESVAVSGVDTRSWTDPDHGRALTIGSPVTGNGDYPGDLDWFLLDLQAGQTVTIRASSINIDASLLVDLLTPANGAAFASDSDTGGGVIGFDSELSYTAGETATYAVAVFDETGFGPGGYVLTVEHGRR